MQETLTWLATLSLEAPVTSKGVLTIFPLLAPSWKERDYWTLEEAYEQGVVHLPETGRVPEITLVIKGDRPVLVIEGDLIVGGWQNRTVNLSLLLEPQKEHTIPVSCVERGRWRPRSPRPSRFTRAGRRRQREERETFSVPEFVAHARLRRRKTRSTLRSMRVEYRPVADQAEVWEEVDTKLAFYHVRSATSDFAAFYERHGAAVEEFLRSLRPQTNQVGAVVAIGEQVVALEVFSHPETWRRLQAKILRSYAADALERLAWEEALPAPPPPDEASAFLQTTLEALNQATTLPAPVGLGEHHLLEGSAHLEGFALTHQNTLYHLFAFPALE